MAISYLDQYRNDPSLTLDAYGTYRRADGSAVMQNADNAQAGELQRLNEANDRIARLNANSQAQGVGQQRDFLTGFDYGGSPFGGAESFNPAGYSYQGTTTNNTKPWNVNNPGGSSGGGSQSMYTQGQNPYLQQMGNALVQQNTQNLQRNILPNIGSQALAAGGYGGSRQGVIESNAIGDTQTANANGLANLNGNGYNTYLQYDLGRRNNDLGIANLGFGYAGLDRQINNDNMSWQQQGINNGLNIWDRLQAGNNTAINSGNATQQTPLNYWQQFSQGANSIGQGYGTSTSNQSNQGNPVLGALGGAQLGSQVSNWWGGGGSSGTNDPFSLISF